MTPLCISVYICVCWFFYFIIKESILGYQGSPAVSEDFQTQLLYTVVCISTLRSYTCITLTGASFHSIMVIEMPGRDREISVRYFSRKRKKKSLLYDNSPIKSWKPWHMFQSPQHPFVSQLPFSYAWALLPSAEVWFSENMESLWN